MKWAERKAPQEQNKKWLKKWKEHFKNLVRNPLKIIDKPTKVINGQSNSLQGKNLMQYWKNWK